MEPLNVRDLVASPGSSRRVVLEVELDELETDLARVPPDAPLRVELLLEGIAEGIFATGPISGRMELSCARCLTPLSRDFRVEVAELFSPDPDEETYALAEETLDLEPMVRDAVVLAMPFSPLCRPDCAGLCERCGGDRNRGECSCPPPADPRWAVLSELKLD